MPSNKSRENLVELLLKNYQNFGDKKIAMRRKDFGIWKEYTWADCYNNVKWLALGLTKLGLKPKDHLAVLGENDPEMYWTIWATQAVRGTFVGIYADAMPNEVERIVNHSESVFVLAEDQEQADKILLIRDKIPKVKRVLYWDPKGMYSYNDPFIINFYDVIRDGMEYEKEHPGLFENYVEGIKSDDIGCLIYTSGTTGIPKGAMWSQCFLMNQLSIWEDKWEPGYEYVSYLSPAWGMEWVLGLGQGIESGAVVNFLEKPDRVQTEIREIAPNIIFFGSRLWESLASNMQAKISDTRSFFRFIYNSLLPIGLKVADLSFQGKRPSFLLKMGYKISDAILFRAIRDKHGLTNVKWAYSAGAGLSPDIIKFFHAIGVNLKQTYGLVEVGMTSLHRDGQVKAESTGPPLKSIEVKLNDQGEVLIRQQVNISGFYGDEKRTREQFDEEGWFHTNDAGHIDEDGHLIIIDRMANLMELGDGRKFSPDFIEKSLRFSPYIKDAMVVGGRGLPFITGIIIIDFDNVGRWAESNHLNYTTLADLSQKSMVPNLILKDIERVNKSIPSWSRIKRFAILHKEFDADEGELTRTRKLKRNLLESRYKDLFDAMCAGDKSKAVTAEVTYQDGRKGTVETDIIIIEVETIEKR